MCWILILIADMEYAAECMRGGPLLELSTTTPRIILQLEFV